MDWFIISCTSGKELASCAILGRMGYSETFVPMRRVEVRRKGKLVVPDKKNPKYVSRAWVPGYVFVCAKDMAFHRVNGTHGKISLRVLSPGGVPYKVTDEQMAKMRDVPKRVRDLTEEVERQEREAWEASRPIMGLAAKITSGPFEGQVGVVLGMRQSEVQVDIGMVPVWVPERYAERAA